MKKRILSVTLVLTLCLALPPPAVFAEGQEGPVTCGDLTVSGGESGIDYSYDEGNRVLTIYSGANVTIAMKEGTAATTTDCIVVNSDSGDHTYITPWTGSTST